jgi:hypothetical protein
LAGMGQIPWAKRGQASSKRTDPHLPVDVHSVHNMCQTQT